MSFSLSSECFISRMAFNACSLYLIANIWVCWRPSESQTNLNAVSTSPGCENLLKIRLLSCGNCSLANKTRQKWRSPLQKSCQIVKRSLRSGQWGTSQSTSDAAVPHQRFPYSRVYQEDLKNETVTFIQASDKAQFYFMSSSLQKAVFSNFLFYRM